MAVRARKGGDEGYDKRLGCGNGRGGVPETTQVVRRYMRVWTCVGQRASTEVPCGESARRA